MAMRANELAEPRHIERLRAELVEVISANFAYPPFFDFRAGALRVRPIDRAKIAEIEQFIRSANFGAIERASPNSPDIRRFIERLMQRYIEVNPAFATPAGARFHVLTQAQAARVASDMGRRFAAYLAGGERDFGVRRQAQSWAQSKRHPHAIVAAGEHVSRQLEAALQQPSCPASGALHPPASRADSADLTTPTPAVMEHHARAGSSAPDLFGGVAQSPSTRRSSDLADQPTGPVAVLPPAAGGQAQLRELPPDLLNLYGAYLGDMEPEAAPAPRVAPAPQPFLAPVAPRPPLDPPPTAKPDARGDQLIFWQLRYQLEAYVRLAARSYGLPGHAADPSSVLDDLRRSGFVDEADLRIAEGVFALTDRVTAQGDASVEDYRQALMLYLLYHRSHINA